MTEQTDRTEAQAAATTGILLRALERYVEDTDAVLAAYESDHNDAECVSSRIYGALLAGHFAIVEAVETIKTALHEA